MDTLSNSVSTLKISSFPPPPPPTTTNRDFHHFTINSHFSSKSNLAPQKTKTFSHTNPSLQRFSSSNTPPFKSKQHSSPIFHNKPATGYAAAIIDVAQKTNSLHSVQRDVQRLLKFLQQLKFQSDGAVDAAVVKRVVEKGNFERHVVRLVKMLMKKNKLGIVEQVLGEFERIYDELCGTQVVLVSSKREIGEDEMLGIAKQIGAVRVKIKNLVQKNLQCVTQN